MENNQNITNEPETVQYHKLIVPILKEIQKMKAQLQQQQAEIDELKKKLK